jgi:hypothetical protein
MYCIEIPLNGITNPQQSSWKSQSGSKDIYRFSVPKPNNKTVPQYAVVAIVTLAKDIPTVKHSQQ